MPPTHLGDSEQPRSLLHRFLLYLTAPNYLTWCTCLSKRDQSIRLGLMVLCEVQGSVCNHFFRDCAHALGRRKPRYPWWAWKCLASSIENRLELTLCTVHSRNRCWYSRNVFEIKSTLRALNLQCVHFSERKYVLCTHGNLNSDYESNFHFSTTALGRRWPAHLTLLSCPRPSQILIMFFLVRCSLFFSKRLDVAKPMDLTLILSLSPESRNTEVKLILRSFIKSCHLRYQQMVVTTSNRTSHLISLHAVPSLSIFLLLPVVIWQLQGSDGRKPLVAG